MSAQRPVRAAVRAALLVVALAAPAACGGGGGNGLKCNDAALGSGTSAPPGVNVFVDHRVCFSVALPSTWRQLPLRIADFDKAADDLRPQSNKIGPALTQLKSVVRAGTRLAALDLTTGATVNMNVLKADGKVQEIVIRVTRELQRISAANFTRENITVAGEPAIRQRFTLPFPGDNGPFDLKETQIYVVHRGLAYIMTLAGESPDLDPIAASVQLA